MRDYLYFCFQLDLNMEYVLTGDGTKTLYHRLVGEHYHSKHGALQEAQHVFMKSGLQFALEKNSLSEISILEVGFGTGLNFILTADSCKKADLKLNYCGIEAFPLPIDVISNMGYDIFVDPTIWDSFITDYVNSINQKVVSNNKLQWTVANQKVLDFNAEDRFDVVYFDAFAAVHQPEMWTEEVLSHVLSFLKEGGVFVTYAITGNLKRSMRRLGCEIEKIPGPPGKREMLRAVKK